MVGDSIEIRVLDSHSGEIKLGITAPRDIVILRKEIYDAVRDENKAAASAEADVAALGEAARRLGKHRHGHGHERR